MKTLMTNDHFGEALSKMAHQIQAQNAELKNFAFVGIHTRGVPLAQRLTHYFNQKGFHPDYGTLNINLYGEDLSKVAHDPQIKSTDLNFNLDGKTIFLCDDVLYTGRTIKTALDAIMKIGNPEAIHLVVWVKRCGRQLPIESAFHALDVQTQDGDNIKVKFAETDGQDLVTLLEKGEY